jgi:hypothetical protein
MNKFAAFTKKSVFKVTTHDVDGRLPPVKYENAAFEPVGLVVFEEIHNGMRVRVFPWHNFRMVEVGWPEDKAATLTEVATPPE